MRDMSSEYGREWDQYVYIYIYVIVGLWLRGCVRCVVYHLSLWCRRVWIQAPPIICVYTQHACDKTSVHGTCERIVFLSHSLSFFLSFSRSRFLFFFLLPFFFYHDVTRFFFHFLSLSFTWGIFYRSFFLFFLISFFPPFFYHRRSSRSAIQRIRTKRVYVFICVHIPRGSDIMCGIQYPLLLHAYAISLFFFFFFSRLFSFLRFLFLPHGGFHFPFCFSFLHSINFVRIGFFLWRPSNFESMIAIFIVFFVYLFSISLKSNENTYMEIIDGNRNEWSNRKLVLKYFADSDYY